MSIVYEFDIDGVCPVDGASDHYEATLTTDDMVCTETILSVVAELTVEPIFQESLTVALQARFGGVLCTVGMHSGIRVTVTVGP